MAEGDVYYSVKAGQFYQEGRRGAVSRDTAVRNLNYDSELDVFIDSRGRTIERELLATQTRTAQRFTKVDLEQRRFISTETRSQIVQENQLKITQLKSNQDIVVRTVVTTPDGRTHVFYRSYGLGSNVDPGEAKSLASKSARAALLKSKDAKGNTYSLTTNDVRNATVRQDFYKRTIGVRRGL